MQKLPARPVVAAELVSGSLSCWQVDLCIQGEQHNPALARAAGQGRHPFTQPLLLSSVS